MNTDDIDPKAFHGNIFESVCAQLSSTRKKGKQIWTESEIRDQLMEAVDVDEETLQIEAQDLIMAEMMGEDVEMVDLDEEEDSKDIDMDEVQAKARDLDHTVVLEAMLNNIEYLKAAVLSFVEKNDLTCYVLGGRRLQRKITASKQRDVESLVFTEWGQRLYFYTGKKPKIRCAKWWFAPRLR